MSAVAAIFEVNRYYMKMELCLLSQCIFVMEIMIVHVEKPNILG